MKYYQQWMIEELARRQSVNQSYSTRAFAKNLRVSASLVSRVINGSMEISPKIASVIITNSKMCEEHRKSFIVSVLDKVKESILEEIKLPEKNLEENIHAASFQENAAAHARVSEL